MNLLKVRHVAYLVPLLFAHPSGITAQELSSATGTLTSTDQSTALSAAPSTESPSDGVVLDEGLTTELRCTSSETGDSTLCAAALFATWSCTALSCKCSGGTVSGKPVRVFFVFSDLGAGDPHDRDDADIAKDSCALKGCTPTGSTVRCRTLSSEI